MICAPGWRPRHQAGNATEPTNDLRWRGGTLTISRRILPARTAASFAVMTSTCQFIASAVSGLSSRKQRWAKAAKSSRSWASSSRWVSASRQISVVMGIDRVWLIEFRHSRVRACEEMPSARHIVAPAKALGHAQISQPDRRPEYPLSALGGGEGRGEVGGPRRSEQRRHPPHPPVPADQARGLAADAAPGPSFSPRKRAERGKTLAKDRCQPKCVHALARKRGPRATLSTTGAAPPGTGGVTVTATD